MNKKYYSIARGIFKHDVVIVKMNGNVKMSEPLIAFSFDSNNNCWIVNNEAIRSINISRESADDKLLKTSTLKIEIFVPIDYKFKHADFFNKRLRYSDSFFKISRIIDNITHNFQEKEQIVNFECEEE